MSNITKEAPIRHGDMFFKLISATEIAGLQAKSRKNLTVGLGEVTGHAHNLKPMGNGEIIEYASDFTNEGTNDFIERERVLFEVKGDGAVIHHEDHDPIILKPGVYVRIHQRTYNPFDKMIRKVAD